MAGIERQTHITPSLPILRETRMSQGAHQLLKRNAWVFNSDGVQKGHMLVQALLADAGVPQVVADFAQNRGMTVSRVEHEFIPYQEGPVLDLLTAVSAYGNIGELHGRIAIAVVNARDMHASETYRLGVEPTHDDLYRDLLARRDERDQKALAAIENGDDFIDPLKQAYELPIPLDIAGYFAGDRTLYSRVQSRAQTHLAHLTPPYAPLAA